MLTVILNVLPFIQLILAIILVALILLQKTDADAGGSFGGGGSESTWHTRRGGEKFIYIFTIIIAIVFVGSVILDLWK